MSLPACLRRIAISATLPGAISTLLGAASATLPGAISTTLGAASATLLGAPAAAIAQQPPHERRGVWFSGGPTFVTAWYTSPYAVNHHQQGGALRLAGGWGLSPTTQLGVSLTAPVVSDPATQDAEIDVSPALTALVRLYPSPTLGLVLSGGLGLGAVRTTDEPGLALEGGIGYDLSLGRHVSLTPNLTVLHIGDRYRSTNYAHFGLAITLD